MLDQTHDPARRSWEASANRADTDFPVQNLPLGIFRRGQDAPRAGAALGDVVVDLAAMRAAGLLAGRAAEAAAAVEGGDLAPLMALGRPHSAALRAQLSELLSIGGEGAERAEAARQHLLVPMAVVTLEMPAKVGSFTDFLSSIDHTSRMARGGPLPPSFKHLPIAYHGRAGTLRVSGTEVRRPNGISRGTDTPVVFGPEPWLDFELELGAFVAQGNAVGEPVTMDQAPDRLFGYCLLNDWSARGIQFTETVPLGPFLGKSFATSISPWVVTAEALAPFAVPARPRDAGDPAPLPHLSSDFNRGHGGLDIVLEAYLQIPGQGAPHRVTRAALTHMYWSFTQMLTHHASNGCRLAPADLLGSGTVSGPTEDSRACLAEVTDRGKRPLTLPGGVERAWLADGDEVIFRARASRDGHVAIGFGECRGRIAPAVDWPQ